MVYPLHALRANTQYPLPELGLWLRPPPPQPPPSPRCCTFNTVLSRGPAIQYTVRYVVENGNYGNYIILTAPLHLIHSIE